MNYQENSMGAEQAEAKGPDLTQGIALNDIPDGGMLGGHVGDEAVLLARRGDEFFAIGATCSHYGGPLAEGLIVGDTVRCPWHHARFSLRTGEAVAAPAFNPMSCWRVEKRDGKVFVREKIEPADRRKSAKTRPASGKPERVVIVGGGAAGGRAGRKLHRARSCRRAANARDRSSCRGAGPATVGTRPRPRIWRFHTGTPRGTRGRIPPRRDRNSNRSRKR